MPYNEYDEAIKHKSIFLIIIKPCHHCSDSQKYIKTVRALLANSFRIEHYLTKASK